MEHAFPVDEHGRGVAARLGRFRLVHLRGQGSDGQGSGQEVRGHGSGGQEYRMFLSLKWGLGQCPVCTLGASAAPDFPLNWSSRHSPIAGPTSPFRGR